MRLKRVSVVIVTLVLMTVNLSGLINAATTVNLGAATTFSVLAGTAITNVPTSTIIGDVGLSPAAGSNYAGLTDAEVAGDIYAVDNSGPAGSVNNPSLLTTAKNDLTAAYIDAAGQTTTTTFGASDNQLGGQTLTPGVYAFGHGTTANLVGSMTLDGQGNANSVFIFKASSDLVTASGSVINLINGANACNIFWQVTSSATLGTGTTFVGSILALTAITDNGSSTVNGRLLARNAAVALNNTTINTSACISAFASGVLPNTSGITTETQSFPWSSIIVILALISTISFAYSVKRNKEDTMQ